MHSASLTLAHNALHSPSYYTYSRLDMIIPTANKTPIPLHITAVDILMLGTDLNDSKYPFCRQDSKGVQQAVARGSVHWLV